MTREYWENELSMIQDRIFWLTKTYNVYKERGYKKAERITGRELKGLNKKEKQIMKILTTK